MPRFFSTYDQWRLDSGREGEESNSTNEWCPKHRASFHFEDGCEECFEEIREANAKARGNWCSFHKRILERGRCDMCDDLDAALDREFGR